MAVVAVVVVVLIIGFFIAAQFSGSNDPFQSAAASLGLKSSRSVPELLPRLEGMVNGLPVRVDIPKQGAPVRYRVFYPPLGMALRLEQETTISRAMGELGQTDTQVGAAAFDNTFKVNTSRPDALREMMTPELRRTLVQLLDAHPRTLIEDGGMTFTSATAEPSEQEIVRTVATMAAAAHQLVEKRPAPLKTPPPQPRPQPKAAPAAQSSPSPETRKNESEKPDKLAVTPTPQQERPEKGRAVMPERAAVAPTPPSSPPPPVAPPDTGLPERFFEEAFGTNRLSFETDGSFEAKYQGTEVSLAGTVKQAREVEDDNRVKVGPSTKATVTVTQIDNDLYGKTDIDAIVFLPRGTAEKLARGTTIAFTGTLETIDPYMRNLFVTEARLRS